MSAPEVSRDVTITLKMTEAQARDVMDDLLKEDPRLGGPSFSSDGSQAVYYTLATVLGERLL